MFYVSNPKDVFVGLQKKIFNYTDDKYFDNLEKVYTKRVLNQKRMLLDENHYKKFILNFRHPSSGSIITDHHSLNGYRPLRNTKNPKYFLKYLSYLFLNYLHPYAYAERDWIDWNYSQYKRAYFGNSDYFDSIEDIGNPPIIKKDNSFKYNLRWLRYLYLRERLFTTLGKNLKDIFSIIDLGGCYGGFVSLLSESLPNKSYTIVELGENIPLAAFYISSKFKGKKINVITSKSDKIIFNSNEINLIPAHLFYLIKEKSFDLFCNYVSLGEMSKIHFEEYINSNAYKKSKYKHIVNRVKSSPYYTKDVFPRYLNKTSILDYDLSGIIKYFDIFPFMHFTPLIELNDKQPISTKFKSLRAFIKPWRRSIISSQQFECIFKLNE